MAKTITQLPDATVVNAADELIVQQGGVTKRATKSEVLNGIVNVNIDAAAAIAHSKLAPLNSAQIIVGNGSNVPTAVSVTGDVTISNAGVTAIGSAKVLPSMLSQPYTRVTVNNSTSGTEVDFTGIPSWAKRITVTLADVSTSGTSNLIIRLGTSGGFQTTGYTGSIAVISSSPAYTNIFSNVGLLIGGATATSVSLAVATIVNHTGNVWICSGTNQRADGAAFINGYFCGGTTLGGTLDRVRITTVNGTDTFDAGTINIAYEG